MSVAVAVSSEKLETFKDLLRELFQLDYAADLDFGIYRIINQRRREISDFLDRDLLPQVKSAFVSYQSEERTRLQDELAKAEAQAVELGYLPETSSKVRQLRERLTGIPDAAALEDEVYSHLTTFFRRYYQNGDFLSLRRYKAGVYAIPYEGEEVKLYWANADQYYIKTAEAFQTYTFMLPSGRIVHFRLCQATTERNNNKATEDGDRRFVLTGDDPMTEEDGALVILFEYRPVEGKPKQATLNKEAVDRLLALPQAAAWAGELSAPSPTEANAARTLLEKHLTRYTARNTFDYFIHKDLGAFLRRELDFYLKSEVVRLDDLDTDDAARADQYLSKVRAIKRVAHKIIDFLAQIEDFQKRLFLKKKLVLQSDYCLTLDRVPNALYPEIAANAAQIAEWKRLFAIEEIAPSLLAPAHGDPLTEDFLRANQSLVLDTCFFDQDFKRRLLAAFDDLDAATDGLIVCSENFQALNLLAPRYQDAIKCIYIDPPYNTGNDGFLYKDNYQHSSWLCMMEDRLTLAKEMLSDDGVIFCQIGDEEVANLRLLGDSVLGADAYVTTLHVHMSTVQGQKVAAAKEGNIVKNAEYIHVWSKNGRKDIGIKPLYERAPYDTHYSIVLIKHDDNTFEEHRLVEVVLQDERIVMELRGLKMLEDSEARPDISNDDLPRVYELSPAFRDFVHNRDHLVCRDDNAYGLTIPDDVANKLVPGTVIAWSHPSGRTYFLTKNSKGTIRQRLFLHDKLHETNENKPQYRVTTIRGDWWDSFYLDLGNVSKEGGVSFGNGKKPVRLIREIVQFVSGSSGDVIMDFFAGSGTTGHAVVDLNRLDGNSRNFILVETEGYFESFLKDRLKKSICPIAGGG